MNEDMREKLAAERKRKQELAKEARQRITMQTRTIIISAITLVSALFWQTAINDTIKAFIPVGGAWFYEIFVALIITLAAAVAIYFLTKEKELAKK